MSVSVWQQFGFLCSEGRNVRDKTLSEFVASSGKWIAVLVDQLGRPNGEGVAWNRANFDDLAKKWKADPATGKPGVERVGPWFNGWARDPEQDAADVVAFVKAHNAGPIVLDLEGDYKGASAWKMPALLSAIREALPTRSIAVTTPGQFDNAMIWNGRTLVPPRSFFDLGVRWLPQWYSGYYLGTAPGRKPDAHTEPVFAMTQLRDLGSSDDNYKDVTAPAWRGLPLSFVKGMLEVTGLENSSLADELTRMQEAKKLGLLPAKGLSGYLLENTPDSDWALFRSVRGVLY